MMNKDQTRSVECDRKSDAIEHRLVAKIKGIFHARQTQLKNKEYLVKYKGCHHKEVMQMKLVHLNHLPKNGEQV
jgi:hypothetical protein